MVLHRPFEPAPLIRTCGLTSALIYNQNHPLSGKIHVRADTVTQKALEAIRQNIARSGHHIYLIAGDGQTPRFAYTIGATESIGFELILAGAIFYMKDDVLTIINGILAQMRAQLGSNVFEVGGQGSFTLRDVHSSWARELLLGAFDYYREREIRVHQIVPDEAHWTIDVPDMGTPWSAEQEPVWRWLREPWDYGVPEKSTAVTNLAALRGSRITEVVRWEDDYWEIFAGAGPDVSKDEMRVVPLGSLIATDASLARVLSLNIGAGVWRDADSDWHPWIRKGSPDASSPD
jgi:hypothetical protein